MPEEDEDPERILEEARSFLDEAARLERAGFPAPALRSAYYAMFHAARALIRSRGSSARTHRGVLSEVNRLLVNDGPLEASLAGDFSRVQSERLKADYEPGLEITEEDAAWALDRARAFLENAAELLVDI